MTESSCRLILPDFVIMLHMRIIDIHVSYFSMFVFPKFVNNDAES